MVVLSYTYLPTNPYGYNFRPVAINDLGQVVGQSEYGYAGGLDVYNLTSNSFTELAALPGNLPVVTGINETDQIVGTYAGPFNNGSVATTFGFEYQNGAYAAISYAPTNIWPFTHLNGINNLGTMVGSVTGWAGDVQYGLVYQNGTATTFSDPLAHNETQAIAINDLGQIVGESDFGGSFLYSGGAFTRIVDPLAGSNGWTNVTGINDSGEIVGTYYDGVHQHGFLYQGGNYTTINGPSGTDTQINGINNLSQIVGTSFDANTGVLQGFVATPDTNAPELFTSGADTVNFNSLTTTQQSAVTAGADLYNALGGGDTITLPNANPGDLSVPIAGTNKTFDFTETFAVGDNIGDTTSVSGNGGSYNIALGAGTDTVQIAGDGNNIIDAGSGFDTVAFNGSGSNTIVGNLTGSISIAPGTSFNIKGGELHVAGNFLGTANIGAGSILELQGAEGGAISFAGGGATLILDQPTQFNGTIYGFGPTDTIDLANVPFGKFGGSANLDPSNPHALDVTVNGLTYYLQLDPAQNFSDASFRLASDGVGGTTITLSKGLTINVSYDTSVTANDTDPTIGVLKASVNEAVTVLENAFTNPVTINIDVGLNTSPLAAGENKSVYFNTGYGTIATALRNGTEPLQQIAAKSLPAITDPVFANANFRIPEANAQALKLVGNNDVPVDGYIEFSSPDVFTALHEITEVMGRISILPASYTTMDLFRYFDTGQRGLTPAQNFVELLQHPFAYFSIDNGVTDLGRWNNNPSQGDLGDWLPLGPVSNGQDALDFALLPLFPVSFSYNDRALMNVLGWNMADPGSMSGLVKVDSLIDGYVSGATVFADANNNGMLDAGEVSSSTDQYGNFVISGGSGPLIAFGGTDISTGLPFKGQLSAPAGSTDITPLTTLLTNLSSDPSAEQKVLSNLGLPSTLELTTFDPIAAAQGGSADGAATEIAGEKVYDTVEMIASLLAGAGGSFTPSLQAAFASLASVLDGAGINLSDKAALSGLITQVAQTESISLGSGVADALASVIAAGNAALDHVLQTDQPGSQLLSDAASVELVMQGAASTAITNAGGSLPQLQTIANLFAGTNLSELISQGIVATPAAVSGTEGVVINATIATFADANPNAKAADFSATISWGDGTATTGTVVAQNGLFAVGGSHTYADEGNYQPAVTINDAGGHTTTATSTATISDAPLSATSATVSGIEGAAINATVATFTDENPTAGASDFTAAINWGDGTTTSGTVVLQKDGSFAVDGSHTYAEEGNYQPIVSISDVGGSTASTISTATIADAPLSATSATVSGTEGAAITNTIATFTDANPNALPSDFAATINWGDGTTSTGTVVAQNGGGFAVDGTHSYAEEGSYQVDVTINDVGGSTANATTTAVIADALLTANSSAISGTEGATITPTVATFTDANPNATAADFSATINWGDGTTTAGTVVLQKDGSFAVDGVHTYAEEGNYQVGVTINDVGGSTAIATSTAAIADTVHTLPPNSNGVAKGQTLSVSAANGVLANDSDPDDLTVEAVNGRTTAVGHSIEGKYGCLTLNADGSYTYKAVHEDDGHDHHRGDSFYWSNEGDVKQDVFTYTASDGHGGLTTSTLSIVVFQPGTTYLSGINTTLTAGNGPYVLDGSAGGDILKAARGDTVLIGGNGDTLTSGRGEDNFFFRTDFGTNTITNFNVHKDTLQFDDPALSNMRDILDHATDTALGAVISDGHGDTVTLLGVNTGQLHHHEHFHLV